MLWDSNEDATKTLFFIDDTYVTPLCQHVQLPFVQHMDRIKDVALIMKFLFQFPVCVA